MVGRVEVSDREIADVVAAGEAEMLELLRRLVQAPTTLGNEEPGQALMEEAFRDPLWARSLRRAARRGAPPRPPARGALRLGRDRQEKRRRRLAGGRQRYGRDAGDMKAGLERVEGVTHD